MNDPSPNPIAEPHISSLLLPVPREITRHPGVCRISRDIPLNLRTDDLRLERAAIRWRDELLCPMAPARLALNIAVEPERTSHLDGYRLEISSGGIDLVGNSPTGCFHGLQTLGQLSGNRPRDSHNAAANLADHSPGPGSLPCCTILDWPDFRTRGLLHDVTRGKVPTLATLKELADRLTILKGNQLQLYIEHAFVFSVDPDICTPKQGLTHDQIRELDLYCKDRFIDLVPALATFGHMGRILSMPKYQHLAEIEPTASWEQMSWPQRMRGITLDCTNPEAHRLIERMWSDLLDAFSAPVVNICGDEPWDLGRGKSRNEVKKRGKGELYLDQVRRTHDICAARGRRTQFWSDVIRAYPQLLDRAPADSTVLHWGYDDKTDYAGTTEFTAAGMETFVCPGTSGWKRIINALDLAERNIATFAAAGMEHGATGLINTDWGDHGHFNLLACSWHGISLGACLGWRADHPTGVSFDERFARIMFGRPDTTGIQLLRKASRILEHCNTWPLASLELEALGNEPSLPPLDAIVAAQRSATAAFDWCQQVRPAGLANTCDMDELAVACRFAELFADKAIAALQPDDGALSALDRASSLKKWTEAADDYAKCWLARNKTTGLEEVLHAIANASKYASSVR